MMKNMVKLRNYYLSGDLESKMVRFVGCYNNRHVHEYLDNVQIRGAEEGRNHATL